MSHVDGAGYVIGNKKCNNLFFVNAHKKVVVGQVSLREEFIGRRVRFKMEVVEE